MRASLLYGIALVLMLPFAGLAQQTQGDPPDDPWPELPSQGSTAPAPADGTGSGPLGTYLEFSARMDQPRIGVYCNGTRPTAECTEFATRLLGTIRDVWHILDQKAAPPTAEIAPPSPPGEATPPPRN